MKKNGFAIEDVTNLGIDSSGFNNELRLAGCDDRCSDNCVDVCASTGHLTQESLLQWFFVGITGA